MVRIAALLKALNDKENFVVKVEVSRWDDGVREDR